MNCREFIWIVAILFWGIDGIAQKATISGYISDENGEMLIGATVYEQQSMSGATTNQYGFFSLTIPTGKVDLGISYIGFQTKKTAFNLLRDTILNVHLLPEVYQQEEVIIIAGDDPIDEKVQLGSIKLSPVQIKKIPSITGEPDVIKAFSMTPGVSNGREGAAGLYVRGGTPDQNLILLDEAVVYNPNHLFGLLSVFNPDAIKSVELIKGGFPARYGGRLSSVLDIATREGNTQKLRGNFGLGITSSRLSLDGPIKKGKTGFMFSGRSAYLDVLTFPVWMMYKNGNVDQFFSYTMYDVNAKLNHKFSDKNKLIISFYKGKDNYRGFDQTFESDEGKFALVWGNTTATVRNNTMLSNKLFWKNMLIYSKFDYQLKASYEEKTGEQIKTEFKSLSGLRDYTFKSAFDYIPSPNHYIKSGIEITQHQFTPQDNEFFSTDTSDTSSLKNRADVPAFEWSVFAEDEWSIGKHFKSNIGFRYSSFTVNDKTYTSAEPRLSLLYRLPQNFALKAAYSSTQQYVHLLTNTGAGFQNDVWVPATERITPQQSQQYSLGLVRSLPKYAMNISLEGYYKSSQQLIELREAANLQLQADEDWENLVETNGTGTSYGIELQVQKKRGQLTGILAYTLSRHTRQFDNINNGKTYPFNYDNRHSFSVTANYALNDYWDVSGTWIYKTGNPISLPVAAYDHPDEYVGFLPAFIDRNSFRLPDYHRADVAFNHTKTTKRDRQRTWTMGVYNLYYRKNVYFARLVNQVEYENGITTRYPKIQAYSLLPIIPSVSYSLTF